MDSLIVLGLGLFAGYFFLSKYFFKLFEAIISKQVAETKKEIVEKKEEIAAIDVATEAKVEEQIQLPVGQVLDFWASYNKKKGK